MQGNLSGSLTHILKVFFGLEAWNLKDSRFEKSSEWSRFKRHKDPQLNDSYDYCSFHINFCRDTAHDAGNLNYCAPKNDHDFELNPPMNELGFFDVFW